MSVNIGSVDRTLRLILGIALLGMGVYFRTWWGALGLILVLTGTLRWCPLYLPFHISTQKRKEA